MIMETCLARELVLFWGFPLVPKVRFGYFVVVRFNDLFLFLFGDLSGFFC